MVSIVSSEGIGKRLGREERKMKRVEKIKFRERLVVSEFDF